MSKEEVPEEVSKYMSKIGKRGGAKSKRRLTSEEAKKMVQARVAKQKKKDLEARLSEINSKES